MQQLLRRDRTVGRSGREWLVKLILPAVLTLTLFFVTPAFADIINGTGAGSLPATALDLTGHNVVAIQGSVDLTTGVAMFEINISNFLGFSAYTASVPFGIGDTELFLFNSSGQAVYANDDAGFPGAAYTLSCLPSAIASNPCLTGRGGLGPTSNGHYYLAIAVSADLPQDAGSNYVFQSAVSSTDIVGPASGAGPVAGWDGGFYTSPNFDNSRYLIDITGAAPEPSTLLLVSPGLLLGWLRRKQIFTKRS